MATTSLTFTAVNNGLLHARATIAAGDSVRFNASGMRRIVAIPSTVNTHTGTGTWHALTPTSAGAYDDAATIPATTTNYQANPATAGLENSGSICNLVTTGAAGRIGWIGAPAIAPYMGFLISATGTSVVVDFLAYTG